MAAATGSGGAVGGGAGEGVVTDTVTVGVEGITNCQYANAISPRPTTIAPTATTMPPPPGAVLGGGGGGGATGSGSDGFSSVPDMRVDQTAGIPPSTSRESPECFTFARRRFFVASIQFASLGSTTPPERAS